MVGWGVLQDPRYPNIPGTVNLSQNAATAGSCEYTRKLPCQL